MSRAQSGSDFDHSAVNKRLVLSVPVPTIMPTDFSFQLPPLSFGAIE